MTTESRVLSVRDPHDLLAAVVCVLGFVPERSVVMLTFGTGGARSFHARVDLPTTAAERGVVAEQLACAAASHRVETALLVVFGSDHDLALRAAGDIAARLVDDGVGAQPMVRADGDRFWPLIEAPGPGERYDLNAHRFVVDQVLAGKVTYGSRRELAATLSGNPREDTAMVGLAADDKIDQILDNLRQGLEDPERVDIDWLSQEHDWLFERLAEARADCSARWTVPDCGRALALIAALPPLWDAVWRGLDRENATADVAIWTQLLRRAPGDLSVESGALLGWTAWLSGDGALAWCAIDRSRAGGREHHAVARLENLLQNAVAPHDWGRVRDLAS